MLYFKLSFLKGFRSAFINSVFSFFFAVIVLVNREVKVEFKLYESVFYTGYVANLFKPRVTPYNLRSNGLNVVQTSYNSRFLHGSYAYMISHVWNQLPSAVKNGPNASSFRRHLTKLNFIGCQCSNCL